MADVEFTPDLAGIREVLHSDGVQKQLRSVGNGIASACCAEANDPHGDGRPYVCDIDQGKLTSLAIVHTHTLYGRRDEAKHQRLESHNH